jgi:hypothetical protein
VATPAVDQRAPLVGVRIGTEITCGHKPRVSITVGSERAPSPPMAYARTHAHARKHTHESHRQHHTHRVTHRERKRESHTRTHTPSERRAGGRPYVGSNILRVLVADAKAGRAALQIKLEVARAHAPTRDVLAESCECAVVGVDCEGGDLAV